MTEGTTSVLVVLNTADESEVPLEVADRVAAVAPDDLDQTVCSFYPPGEETFEVEIRSLDATHRIDPGAYRELVSLIRETDVIHVHPNSVGSVARLVAAVSGTAVVTSEHNTHPDLGTLTTFVNGGTNWLSDIVIAVSEAVADSFGRWEETLLRLGGAETTVIHNGVDVDAVAAAADRPVPVDLPDGFLIGSGGRMVPQKNLATVIEAVAMLAETGRDPHLVLTGDGPKRESLERLAADRGIDDRVLFTGYLDRRADVHALFHELDAYTLPSRHEGWGVAVGEAMAAGLPVVVGDIPPFREVVGEAGRLVDPEDPRALAEHLERLSDDDDLRTELGTAGQRRIRERFPIERTARAHVALYRRLGEGGQ